MSELSSDPNVDAQKLGKIVVLPEASELQIDVDGNLCEVEELVLNAQLVGLPITITKRIASKTPGHWHVYCTVDCGDVVDEDDLMMAVRSGPRIDLTPELRCALQAALGSDRKRELLSLARILLKVPRDPTLFFEDPKE